MDLPPNATLCEMQQNTHGLVQLIGAARLNDPNQTPMQQLPCTIHAHLCLMLGLTKGTQPPRKMRQRMRR